MRQILDPLLARGPLRDPVMVLALAVRRRAGRAASGVIDHLVEAWDAELVAQLDAQDTMDLTVRRPQIRRSEESVELDWPDIDAYVASPRGSEHDFILVTGFEPHFHWRTFVEGLADYADALGVKTLISLRVFPGLVPHTRPAPVLINSSDIELELQFGVQTGTSRYEGPADAASVFAAKAQQLRWRTVDLTVLQPEYMPRGANPAATLSFATALDHVYGTNSVNDELRSAVATQRSEIDEAIATDAEKRGAIAELESQYDAGAERMDFLRSGGMQSPNLPSGEQVIEEIERMFREGGDA
jgi:hypothetical protein